MQFDPTQRQQMMFPQGPQMAPRMPMPQQPAGQFPYGFGGPAPAMGMPNQTPGIIPPGMIDSLNQSVRQMQPAAKPALNQKPEMTQPMDGEMARRRRYGQALMARRQTPKLPPGQTPGITGAPQMTPTY